MAAGHGVSDDAALCSDSRRALLVTSVTISYLFLLLVTLTKTVQLPGEHCFLMKRIIVEDQLVPLPEQFSSPPDVPPEPMLTAARKEVIEMGVVEFNPCQYTTGVHSHRR